MKFKRAQATTIDTETIVKWVLILLFALVLIVGYAILREKDFGLIQHIKDLFRFGS
jgi:hypothetical protein